MNRIQKERPADLAGQQLTAAIYFQGLGSAAGQLTFGSVHAAGQRSSRINDAQALQNAAAARDEVIAREREGFHRPRGSLAADFPDSKGVLAVTDRQLIVFGYHQGLFRTRIEAPITRIALSDLSGWSHTPGGFAWTLNLAFRDDSDVGLDLPIANKPAEFVEALGISSAA
jgi:hypothetical protein